MVEHVQSQVSRTRDCGLRNAKIANRFPFHLLSEYLYLWSLHHIHTSAHALMFWIICLFILNVSLFIMFHCVLSLSPSLSLSLSIFLSLSFSPPVSISFSSPSLSLSLSPSLSLSFFLSSLSSPSISPTFHSCLPFLYVPRYLPVCLHIACWKLELLGC